VSTPGDRPCKVYVEPTTSCNLECRTCVRHSWDEPEGFMEWPTFEAVVQGLAGRAESGTIAFMGLGEPLLHPRFLDMVQLAKRRGLRAEVTTNALLLDEAMAAGLLAAGLDQLVVSIDGASAEAFGRVRSGASLTRVVENTRRLNDARGSNYGPSMRIGVEFVAMRSNIDELPGLGRLAARLGARFILVTNVLPYAEELAGETLYDVGVMASGWAETTAGPRWQLPRFGWDEQVGAAVGAALQRAGHVSFLDGDVGAEARCPFVEADACAVAWHGGVSPCPPLLHTYPCYVRGRRKLMTRWQVGSLTEQSLAEVWAVPEYFAFRERVSRFDFPPCTDCACELAESNEEDCFGNPHPTCGDCLWARGVVRCA
jgi:MoaA/NifB/PqqE/SkfB family radical SAM enzyme